MIDQLSNSVPQIKAGTVRAYALASPTRAPAMPDVPTTDEAGLTGFYGGLWHGLWAPKGVPEDVVAKLNVAVKQSLADPVVQQKLAAVGQEIVPPGRQTPPGLAAFQQAEAEKWFPVVKAAGMRGE
jgi:tripartite-type tricarboxylate transporter receptor subunit TctC